MSKHPLPKIGVLGARGKVGRVLVDELVKNPDFDFTVGINSDGLLTELLTTGTQICVDFTQPDAVVSNLEFLIKNGIHAVVGTTGFTPKKYDQIRDLLASNPGIGVIISPNFAIGAVLTMKFAELAARFFTTAEIIELHNSAKKDAPSGTSIATAQRIKQGRINSSIIDDKSFSHSNNSLESNSRGSLYEGVPIHSVRGAGLVAHEEVIFSGPGEVFTLRHDSLDRTSFIPGILLAVKAVVDRPGLTIGIEDLLNLGEGN